jgi:AGCS family alanine or glycine:cation symporter
VALGCSIQLNAVLEFSDALVFLICVPNIIGLYLLAPQVRGELRRYNRDVLKAAGKPILSTVPRD